MSMDISAANEEVVLTVNPGTVNGPPALFSAGQATCGEAAILVYATLSSGATLDLSLSSGLHIAAFGAPVPREDGHVTHLANRNEAGPSSVFVSASWSAGGLSPESFFSGVWAHLGPASAPFVFDALSFDLRDSVGTPVRVIARPSTDVETDTPVVECYVSDVRLVTTATTVTRSVDARDPRVTVLVTGGPLTFDGEEIRGDASDALGKPEPLNPKT